MAIALSSTGTFTERTAEASSPVPYPATVNAGDCLVLRGSVKSAGSSVISTPAGWTLVDQISPNSNGTSPAIAAFVKIAAGTETGTLSVSHNSTASAWQILAFSGVDQTTPVDVFPTPGGAGEGDVAANPTVITGLTGVSAGAALLTIVSKNVSTVTATPPAGFTETGDRSTGTASCEFAHLLGFTGGSTGNVSVTWSSSTAASAGILFALRPAGATNVNGDVAQSETGATATGGAVGTVAGAVTAAVAATLAAGLMAATGAASTTGTGTTTASGAVGTSSSATTAATDSTTAVGAVGRTTGAVTAGSGATTASGAAGAASGATTGGTGATTAAGLVGKVAGVTFAATGATTAAGSVTAGLASSATTSGTGTTTAAGVVGTQASAATAATGGTTTTGIVGRSAGATATGTGTTAAAGSVTSGLSSSATTAGTGSTAATGLVGRSTSVSSSGTGATTAAGTIGLRAGASTSATGATIAASAAAIQGAAATTGVGITLATGQIGGALEPAGAQHTFAALVIDRTVHAHPEELAQVAASRARTYPAQVIRRIQEVT